MRTGHDCTGQAVVQGLTSQSGIHFSGAVVPAQSTFGCVICGINWVVLLCGLKPATTCVGPGTSWDGLQCKPWSAAACVWPEATW